MSANSEDRRGVIIRRGLFALSITVVVCIVVILVEACLVASRAGYWIEMFNGATWPSTFAQVPKGSPTYDGWFYLALTVRTVLNLGAGLTAAIAILWFVFDGPRRYVVRTLDDVLYIRDTAVAGFLIKSLKDNDMPLSEDAKKIVYAAAREFSSTEAAKHFKREANHAASPPAPGEKKP